MNALSRFGSYEGRLLLEPLPDGRLMQLVEPFGFTDSKRQHWPVPKDAQVDGASIPRALWSLIGGPFEGLYRNASVIHDYHCDVRIRPWQTVHRVFYDGMRASGVGESRAKLMYGAVYYAGPRWSEAARHNAELPRIGLDGRAFSAPPSRFEDDVLASVEFDGHTAAEYIRTDMRSVRGMYDAVLHLKRFERVIEDYDPTPDEISMAIDKSVSLYHHSGASGELRLAAES